MHDVLVELLHSLEGVYPPIFSFDDIWQWPEDEFRRCIAAGLLTPGRPATNLHCHDCGKMEEVVYLKDLTTNQFHAYARCSKFGPTEITIERLKQWLMSYERFMDTVFAGISFLGGREEIVRDRVWKLGRGKWSGVSRMTFFARGLHRPDAWKTINQTPLTLRSVVFVPAKLPEPDSRTHVLPVIIPLVDVLSWSEASICFDHSYVQEVLANYLGAAEQVDPAKPTRKRATRTATIELLTKHLIDHIKTARNHLLAHRQYGHNVMLLPRPTKRELARLIGVSEATVGRCIADPAARELRFLWELATDINRLLDYGDGARS